MKAFRIERRRFAVLLPGLPPFADVFRMRRIADIEDHHDAALVARIARREIGIFAARIGIAVRAGDAAYPRSDRLGFSGSEMSHSSTAGSGFFCGVKLLSDVSIRLSCKVTCEVMMLLSSVTQGMNLT